MSSACGTYERDDKCIQSVRWEAGQQLVHSNADGRIIQGQILRGWTE